MKTKSILNKIATAFALIIGVTAIYSRSGANSPSQSRL